jgi:hypothetical protein
MAVLSRNAKAEDIPQMDKAIHNFFPLFIVDWMNRTTLVLGLFQPAIWIIEDSLASRGAG